MDLSITENKQNNLLSRQEIRGEIVFTGTTPSYAEVQKAILGKIKGDEKGMVIKHVYTDYGRSKASFLAYLYEDENQKKSVEPRIKPKKKQNG